MSLKPSQAAHPLRFDHLIITATARGRLAQSSEFVLRPAALCCVAKGLESVGSDFAAAFVEVGDCVSTTVGEFVAITRVVEGLLSAAVEVLLVDSSAVDDAVVLSGFVSVD